MTRCVVCRPRSDEDEGHEASEGWLVCDRAWNRMAAALRAIPDLVVELSGLGYVQRDGFTPKVVYPPGHERAGALVPHRDPVANGWPAGPLNGSKGAPRVSGSPDARVPIRIDSTDLLGAARPAQMSVAVTGLYAADQIGHLAVATELEFWARDWADARRESVPLPTVPLLAAWLLDRLDWACGHHMALDEFAEKLRQMRSALTAAAGRFDAPVETLSAPCPECHTLSLYRDTDIERIGCGSCARLMTEDEYAEHVQRLIKENPS